MKHNLLVISLASLIFTACNTPETQITEQDVQAVRTIMQNQEDAWNDGDLESFMTGYHNSEDIRFSSSAGTTYGYNQLLKAYKKSFASKEAMGQLRFELDSIYTDRIPYIQVQGQWTIFRADTIGGRFVLTFEEQENEGWKIIEDHTW